MDTETERPKLSYIDDQSGLSKAIDELKVNSHLCIDLEFDKNRYRFGFTLCLIQIFSNGQSYIVDPLSSDLDLRPFFQLLEDDGIEVIAYAFGEDMRLLHSMKCFPSRIYDVAITASLVNYPAISLSNILKEALDIPVGKSEQKSNWFDRPLSSSQIEYALEDVIYLPRLKEALEARISKEEVIKWIRQEQDHLNTLSYEGVDDNPLFKVKDKKGLTKYEWYLMKTLLKWRREMAEKRNRPEYIISSVETLRQIAQHPEKAANWANLKGIYGPIKTAKYGQHMQSLVNSAIKEANAKNLSKETLAMDPVKSQDKSANRAKQMQLNKLKESFFKPIKALIAVDYGENTAAYILTNREMEKLVLEESQEVLPYKLQLIRKYAAEANLPLPDALILD